MPASVACVCLAALLLTQHAHALARLTPAAGPTTTPLGAHAPRTFFDKLFSLHRHGPWAMRGGARKRGSNAQARLPCNYAHVSATTLTFRVANHAHA